MTPSTLTAHFEGASGALTVSLIAFTIVFLVLVGLTAVIYAIKIFSGAPTPPAAPSVPAAPAAPAQAAASAAPVSASSSACSAVAQDGSITAAITAAILAATQGRGRILSVSPAAGQPRDFAGSNHNWKMTGRVERTGSRLVRPRG